jgi:hypothetical protein
MTLTIFRISTYGSVHSKELDLPLESTLMKNIGGGEMLWLTRIPSFSIPPPSGRIPAPLLGEP